MICERTSRQYCYQDISLIENYEKAVIDTEHQWDCHHRLEIQGQFRNSVKLLKRCKMYFNRPALELIFLTHSEHMRLHNSGKHLSDDAKKKLSEAAKGNKNRTGKNGYVFTEEHRRKLSEAKKRNKNRAR